MAISFNLVERCKAELANIRGRNPAVILDERPVEYREFEGGVKGFKNDLYVLFLPSQATSHVQPLDQEVIQGWKVC